MRTLDDRFDFLQARSDSTEVPSFFPKHTVLLLAEEHKHLSFRKC